MATSVWQFYDAPYIFAIGEIKTSDNHYESVMGNDHFATVLPFLSSHSQTLLSC